MMPLVALGLVLLAACFHAGWNLTLHGASDRVAAAAVSGLVGGLLLLPATVLSPPWAVLPLIGLSALAETAYALGLSAAYRRGALALAYPIARGTAPLLVTLGGWIVLTQRPAGLALAGALLLATGLALVATAGHRSGHAPAVVFALLTGVAIACYSLVDARAVRSVSPAAYLGPVLLIQGFLLTLWLRCDVSRLAHSLKPGSAIAAGSVAAYLLVLLAFQRAPAGRVATLREVSVLLGILIARQRTGRQVWLGAICVVAGIVLAAV